MDRIENMGLPKVDKIVDGIRCAKCGKLVAKNHDFGQVEIKCPRCGTLNKVFEKMVEQVIITDPAGKILFINPAMEAVTGFALHEAVGKKPSELWGGQMEAAFYKEMWEKMLAEKKTVQISMVNKKKSGELYSVNLSVSPILDENAEVLFYVGIEVLN